MYREYPPPPHLAAVVECFWLADHERASEGRRILPDGCVDLLFESTARAGDQVRLVGTMTTAQVFNISAGASFAAARFHPAASAALFGVPGKVTTDRAITYAEIAGSRAARHLASRIGGADSPAARIAALTDAIPEPGRPSLAAAVAAWMTARRGVAAMDDAARLAGVSPRHLRRLFLDELGLSPKHLCRILRFRRAVSLASSESGWADVAAASGYFDQAHLVRDFREFTGLAPGQWRTSVSSNIA